jgi:hypothetical protein
LRFTWRPTPGVGDSVCHPSQLTVTMLSGTSAVSTPRATFVRTDARATGGVRSRASSSSTAPSIQSAFRCAATSISAIIAKARPLERRRPSAMAQAKRSRNTIRRTGSARKSSVSRQNRGGRAVAVMATSAASVPQDRRTTSNSVKSAAAIRIFSSVASAPPVASTSDEVDGACPVFATPTSR